MLYLFSIVNWHFKHLLPNPMFFCYKNINMWCFFSISPIRADSVFSWSYWELGWMVHDVSFGLFLKSKSVMFLSMHSVWYKLINYMWYWHSGICLWWTLWRLRGHLWAYLDEELYLLQGTLWSRDTLNKGAVVWTEKVCVISGKVEVFIYCSLELFCDEFYMM